MGIILSLENRIAIVTGASRGIGKTIATLQIALSMAFLVVTGIFLQSLANIGRIDLGLDIESVVRFSIPDIACKPAR